MNTDTINNNYEVTTINQQIVPIRMYRPLVGLLNMVAVTAQNGQLYKERYIDSISLESIKNTIHHTTE